MRKLIASFALGIAALGLLGVAHAQEAAASAPEIASAVEAGVAPALITPQAAPAVEVTPEPTVNKGDVAWMMISTMLVILMVVPGLALFYGGLVRSKNMLSVLMQVLVVFSLIVVLWAVYGYSLAFGGEGLIIAVTGQAFLNGITPTVLADTFTVGVKIPELIFVAFQATFAGITCALIVGSFAERMKFGAVLLFSALWFTFSYLPIAHMVWGAGGYLLSKGALDFAGGTVVHINAGRRRPGGCLHARQAHGLRQVSPWRRTALTLTMVGASLLWVGWFGFNAGSNLEANGGAALAFINTLWPPPLRCWPGASVKPWARARPRCWVPPRVRLPVWWPSRPLAARSARWVPS
jgi:Amt family ammonium transporter